MRTLSSIIVLPLIALVVIAANENQMDLDSNAAFFEGGQYNYIFYPPDDFKLVFDEALNAGYSMALVPEWESYDSASIVIDINIFRLKNKKADKGFLQDLIADDTAQVRKHYGKGLRIRPVDSVFNADNRLMPTFYFDDSSRFIPTVMMSYFNGVSEIVIFELTIKQLQPRFSAEQKFENCLNKFKTLIRGNIEERNKRLREGG